MPVGWNAYAFIITMHLVINYAVNRKWIADFDAALEISAATKKAPECCGFVQFQRGKPCRSGATELLPPDAISSRNRPRNNIQSIASFVPG
jgi:hypothetical protein